MKATYQHIVYGSFLLWVDHKITEKGQAYYNHSSLFYDTPEEYLLAGSDIYTYGLPFKQIVADSSISGAQIMSGLYLDGVFTEPGEGDFIDFNYNDGTAYFSASQDGVQISGNYAIKEIDIVLTDISEEDLLFETKYDYQPKTNQQLTGLAPNTLTYPILFVKNNGGTNEPFCFGGTDLSISRVRCILMAENAWQRDGVESILKDLSKSYMPLIYPEENPFNAIGGLREDYYDYNEKIRNKGGSSIVYVDDVFVSRINNSSANKAFTEINKDVHVSFIDFELHHPREPRI